MTSSFAFLTKTYLMINIFHLWLFSAPNHPGKPLHPWTMWEKSAPNHPDKPLHPPPFSGKAPLETTHFKNEFPLGTSSFVTNVALNSRFFSRTKRGLKILALKPYQYSSSVSFFTFFGLILWCTELQQNWPLVFLFFKIDRVNYL